VAEKAVRKYGERKFKKHDIRWAKEYKIYQSTACKLCGSSISGFSKDKGKTWYCSSCITKV
jgi:formamidopyrimidine-DNA glycosylase|tara:strand:- start:1093 stop:1275 length:183 start_codon:yes stop_codon:yes gene_type:complete